MIPTVFFFSLKFYGFMEKAGNLKG